MSADTSKKQTKPGFNGETVLPQPVSNPSIIESVAGFIHEVVPQAYSSVLPGESKESIVWARFESCDFNDPENYPQITECESESIPPLLLVLGYGTGVQVWSVTGGGDATEVLSWSQGTVRTFRLLSKPRDDPDPFISRRPLVAIVDNSGPGPQFCTVNFVSLKTAEIIKSIKFKTPICDVFCNRKSIVITFVEKIAIFDTITFEDRMTILTCYPSPGIHSNPVALGHRWLAYAEKRLSTWQRSSGGSEGDGTQSYTATAIHAVKTLGKGLRDLSGSLTGNVPQPVNNNSAQPGIVTVIDIETKPSKEEETDNVIAHFVAHAGPIVAMTFDSSGLLLVTADKHGHQFHVFRIHPHPVSSQLAAVHHLYILHRGETTAKVQDITVSWDSRWVAVSSVRGTTHVFPITPYGGPVTVRTHTTPNVVNRLSRFERSAGLSDGRGSPLLEAPSQPLNPRLPPYPHPTTLSALAQIRRTPAGEESPLAGAFGQARAWIPGRPKGKKPITEALFIISSSGTLVQYDLDPKCIPGVPKDKISYDTGIELGVEGKAEWPLFKLPYISHVQPPLLPNNPLLDTKLPSKVECTSSNDDRWLSQVEIVTHTGPHRRLWMGPQFSFKSIDPLPSSEGDSYSENINPVRSNPVNMPLRPYLLIEGGSGGSIDSPHLTGYGSGSEEIGLGESRLREDLADAMLEPATQNTGVVGGVRLKAAILERQVNSLGTVITLPTKEQLLQHQQQQQHSRSAPSLDKLEAIPSTSTLFDRKVDDENLVQNVSNISLDNICSKMCVSLPETKSVELLEVAQVQEPEIIQIPDEKKNVGKQKGKSKKKNKKNHEIQKEKNDSLPSESSDSDIQTNIQIETDAVSSEIVPCETEDILLDSESNSEPTAIEISHDLSEADIKSEETDLTEQVEQVENVESVPETNLITIEVEESPEIEVEETEEAHVEKDDSVKDIDFMELLEKRRKSRLSRKTIAEVLSEPKKIPVEEISSSNNEEESLNTDTSSGEVKEVPERPKRDRSKKLRSVDDEKNKSPSPVKSDSKPDTDSSDEAAGKGANKQPKRKRGKKSDEVTPEREEEPKLKAKSKSEGTLDVEKSDYETCSEKKSDSSVESFPDLKKKTSDSNGNFQESSKLWSSIVKNVKEPLKPSNSAEDRDSVYESCNDEEFPPVTPDTAFESGKEDFGPKPETPKTESGSSNAEEKTDSGEKESTNAVQSSKKIRKQKKKRR